MVNGAGHMVIGFSGSKSTEHIGAFYSGCKADGTTVAKPILIQAGTAYSAPGAPNGIMNPPANGRWGDYSYTTLDPMDQTGLTFWTIQEYAETADNSNVGGAWGTWITSVKVVPEH
jgi:hypothetical protein